MEDILLVESNRRDAQVTLQSFRRNGLVSRIHVASDGREALDFLFSKQALAIRNESQPILILLNLDLPLIDGQEVLRIIKSDERTRQIPVVVLGPRLPGSDGQNATRERADAVLGKPVTFRKLLDVAKNLGIPLSYEKREFSAGDRLAR
jgi:two-component system, response regulator